MTPAATLVADLAARGIAVEAHGHMLRVVPIAGLTEGELDALRAHKLELLRLLAAPPRQVAPADTLTATLAPAGEPCAWRIYSNRVARELWVIADADALADLGDARAGLPCVLAADVERLRSMDDAMLARVLDVLAAFPGARVAAVLRPEAAQ
jgi:hypothetical protein